MTQTELRSSRGRRVEPPRRDRRRCAAALFGAAVAACSLPGAALAAAGGDRAPAWNRPSLSMREPAKAVLMAVARAGERLVAVGERGLVIVSDDGGQRWTQVPTPVAVTLTNVRFRSARMGWAVGSMGVVLRTNDGGSTWERVLDGVRTGALALDAARAAGKTATRGAAPAEAARWLEDAERLVAEGADKPFLDIVPGPRGELTAVGAYGLAFTSRDDGANWSSLMMQLPNPEGLSLYGLADREGEQWIYGEQGLLLRAEHATERWVAQPSPSSGSLFASVALRDGPLLLMGLRGKVLRSASPATPWEEVSTAIDASLFAGTELADGTVAVVGAAGQLLISRDHGQRFRPVPLAQRFPFAGLAQAPDGALVLVGRRGLVRVASSELPQRGQGSRSDARAPGGVTVSVTAQAGQAEVR